MKSVLSIRCGLVSRKYARGTFTLIAYQRDPKHEEYVEKAVNYVEDGYGTGLCDKIIGHNK
ncbi:hypothetical protein [Acetobacterium bakii]|uniref:hypothetical protein n=1 Tax=Acetobacterium bakii TaxID=52689 RepID=UPI000F8EB019|nr:hypothetical protein [Acetobacterium bakii]